MAENDSIYRQPGPDERAHMAPASSPQEKQERERPEPWFVRLAPPAPNGESCPVPQEVTRWPTSADRWREQGYEVVEIPPSTPAPSSPEESPGALAALLELRGQFEGKANRLTELKMQEPIGSRKAWTLETRAAEARICAREVSAAIDRLSDQAASVSSQEGSEGEGQTVPKADFDAYREQARELVAKLTAERDEALGCEACREAAGGECHTPGCRFWMADSPPAALAASSPPVTSGERTTAELLGEYAEAVLVVEAVASAMGDATHGRERPDALAAHYTREEAIARREHLRERILDARPPVTSEQEGARKATHSVQRDVEDFHAALDIPTHRTPAIRRPKLRADLIAEEARETLEAITGKAWWIEQYDAPAKKCADGPSLVEAIDGFCDLLCVVYGAAAEFGVDLAPFWDEVHRTNMAKRGGPVREDGKRLKPEGWTPPDIAGILADLASAPSPSSSTEGDHA